MTLSRGRAMNHQPSDIGCFPDCLIKSGLRKHETHLLFRAGLRTLDGSVEESVKKQTKENQSTTCNKFNTIKLRGISSIQ